MEAVVEFHGFKDNACRFIVKEFAIVGRSYKTHVLFRAPYGFNTLDSKMRRTAQWLTRYFHHIKWDEGDFEYSEEFIRSICKPFDVIHTKGREKTEFLREFHSNVVEIDECLHVNDTFHTVCFVHNGKNDEKCALRSAEYFAQNLPF